MITFKQNTEYTCGIAALKTLLAKLKKSLPTENKLIPILNTTEEYGTTLYNILRYLVSKNIVIKLTNEPIPKTFGICLVNVNNFYNEYPKDGQNGHWVYFEADTCIIIHDPYTDQIKKYTIEEFKKYTSNIKIKNKTYSNIFLYKRMKK